MALVIIVPRFNSGSSTGESFGSSVRISGEVVSTYVDFKIVEIVVAASTKTSPTRAFLIVFLACSNESGEPAEVINSRPPFTKKKVLATPASKAIALKELVTKADNSFMLVNCSKPSLLCQLFHDVGQDIGSRCD